MAAPFIPLQPPPLLLLFTRIADDVDEVELFGTGGGGGGGGGGGAANVDINK